MRVKQHAGGLAVPEARGARPAARGRILLTPRGSPTYLISSMYTVTPRERVFTLAGILMALFLGALDQTIVATAMPRILKELKGFPSTAGSSPRTCWPPPR